MHSKGSVVTSLLIALALLIVIAAGAGYVLWKSGPGPLTSPYHAVLLSSGQLYFGRIEKLGTPWSPYTVLTDVYYVQVVQNQETKQSSNVLIRRGKEWHAPDRMVLNANLVLMIEPVTENSKVSQLIAQEKAGR